MDRLPEDMEYFELFEEIASIARRSAEKFCSPDDPEEKKQALVLLEHEGDQIITEVTDRLDRHQDPPLRGDPDDIYRLVDNIDNVIDSLKKASVRIVLYELEHISQFNLMGELILQATRKIEEALPLFRKKTKRNRDKIGDICIEISSIEADGDDKECVAISYLRDMEKEGSISVIDFFLTKEVIELLEHALNQCEDVSDFMDTLKKKNA